jgi:choice-of-anchor A domain-containing protein
MPLDPAHRRRLALAATAALVLAPAVGATATAAPTAARTAPTASSCPAIGDLPGISTNDPLFTDDGIAVFVGGDYTALGGAAESEGVLAAAGDVRVQTGGLLNVGRAGGGSQIVPPAGSDMLVAGGSIDVTGGRLDVGHKIYGPDGSAGGNVVAGSTVAPRTSIETNGGQVLADQGPDVAAGLASLGDALAALSADLDARPVTGTATLEGAALRLVGDGTTGTQVFRVDARDLAVAGELHYSGIGATAPVVVTVEGSEVSLAPHYQAIDGARVDDPAGGLIGNASGRILWNLVDATAVSLGTNDQLVGSVLVPSADSSVAVRTSTNGRLYVGGDLTVGGTGTHGLEHHAYPWIGAELTGCTPGNLPAPPDATEETQVPSEPVAPEAPGEPAAPAGPAGTTTPPLAPATPVADEPVNETRATPDVEAASVPAPTDAPGLATTGASVALLATLATLLLGAGATLLVIAARRRAAR